eukprot:TRINITY_DN56314_c0_g1_i1.p2 TRINITY_DN56314_c0_g1~~TRINITY_DN56314_c0_g1_i1.p2  ORF type:complete len:578 (-),score=250.57 TRINITY_DN56314_c0_g1_i1:2-1735(-)
MMKEDAESLRRRRRRRLNKPSTAVTDAATPPSSLERSADDDGVAQHDHKRLRPNTASRRMRETDGAGAGVVDEQAERRLAEQQRQQQRLAPKVPKRSSLLVMKASYDVHSVNRCSPLSSEAPPQDFRGLYNLAGITLVVGNFRLVVENLRKYGWLIEFPDVHDWRSWPRTWPVLTCTASLIAFPIIAWLIERIACRTGTQPAQRLPRLLVAWMHVVNCAACFFVPVWVIFRTDAAILPAITLLMSCIVVSLKLISFAHVANDLRRDAFALYRRLDGESDNSNGGQPKRRLGRKRKASSDDGRVSNSNDSSADSDPDAATLPNYSFDGTGSLSHIMYFVAAPTLCYQLVYPRTPRVRMRFVVRRVAEMLFCIGLMLFLVKQYVEPTVQNTLRWLDEHPHATGYNKYAYLLERIFKLAIPNGCVWLLMFYALFHAHLNLLAELLRFGDRRFYDAWWNATTLDEYWRKWNLPVHNWLVRHLYAPLLRHGWSKTAGMVAVFLFSAVLHEVLLSVPMQRLRLHAFFGIFGQIPLIWLTRTIVKRYAKPVWGNVCFWTAFLVFGQPLIVLFYAHDFVREQQNY